MIEEEAWFPRACCLRPSLLHDVIRSRQSNFSYYSQSLILCIIVNMKVAVVLAALVSAVAAFTAPNTSSRQATELAAERREFLSSAAAFAGMAAFAPAANALRDYEGLPYLGGSKTVDLNNANVRVYLKMPGMYPTVAGKIVSNVPYKSVSDVYNIPGLSGAEKDIIKKYESRFIALPPQADYVIDNINNGLYR